jgi:DNA-directed RNA polymerase subunit E'/Rpb7
MDFPIVSPYKNTEQFTTIQVQPFHMNSDIISNMEMILKQKVEKKCNKYGFIDKVYNIENYNDGEMVNENFNGAANYKITYNCRVCLPVENTIIVAKVHSVNSELIITTNGPIISFIPKENIDSSIWDISNEVRHKEKDIVLKQNDYVKIIIARLKVNLNDTQIKTIGVLYDYATKEEKEKYFGSIIEEELDDEDNFIL